MYYKYFNVYDNASDYNNANHGRTPNVSLVKDGADVHYQEIQYRTIVANDNAWSYQKEYDNIEFQRNNSTSLNNYQSIALPFDYKLTDEDFENNTLFYKLNTVSESKTSMLNITQLSPGDILYHDIPYVFKSSLSTLILHGHRNKCYNYTGGNVLVPSVEMVTVEGNKLYKFYCFYSNFTVTTGSTYWAQLTTGGVNQVGANVTLKAYRWTFTVSNYQPTLQSVTNSSSNGLLMGGLTYNPNIISEDEDGTEF